MRVLAAADLEACREREVERLAAAREMTMAVAGPGELRGWPLAAALQCSWLACDPAATIHIDVAPAWAGVVARIGRRALTWYVDNGATLTAVEAHGLGLCDAITTAGEAASAYAQRWLDGRSALALDTVAPLLRMRGGDALERAAFAWLFSTGEPAEGLSAFLERRRPEFRNNR